LANNVGIDLFDTAVQYGNAEERLGQQSISKRKIVTKIGFFSVGNTLIDQIENSFKNLQSKSIYGCLFHNCNDLIENKDLWTNLLKYKEAGRIKKIGFSLYEPDVLLELLQVGFIPDIVQVPFSILDRKFEPYFDMLKKKSVEIHVRSIFLQGLYFKNPSKLSGKLIELQAVLTDLHNICLRNKINMLQLCLNFVEQYKNIDYAVIGIETVAQLQEVTQTNIWELNWESIIKSTKHFSMKKELLNPINW